MLIMNNLTVVHLHFTIDLFYVDYVELWSWSCGGSKRSMTMRLCNPSSLGAWRYRVELSSLEGYQACASLQISEICALDTIYSLIQPCSPPSLIRCLLEALGA